MCEPHFNTTVYRKPTHTAQYLHWDSNHFITAKHSVYNTLAHRTKVVLSNQKALHKTLDHIKRALQACKYPPWALYQLQHKFTRKHNNNQGFNPANNFSNAESSSSNKQQQEDHYCGSLHQGIREKFKKVCHSNTSTLQGRQHFKNLTSQTIGTRQ